MLDIITVNAIDIDLISIVPRPEWDISAMGKLSCYQLTVNAIDIDLISFVPRPEWDISATGKLSCRLNLPEGRAPCALHILQ